MGKMHPSLQNRKSQSDSAQILTQYALQYSTLSNSTASSPMLTFSDHILIRQSPNSLNPFLHNYSSRQCQSHRCQSRQCQSCRCQSRRCQTIRLHYLLEKYNQLGTRQAHQQPQHPPPSRLATLTSSNNRSVIILRTSDIEQCSQ